MVVIDSDADSSDDMEDARTPVSRKVSAGSGRTQATTPGAPYIERDRKPEKLRDRVSEHGEPSSRVGSGGASRLLSQRAVSSHTGARGGNETSGLVRGVAFEQASREPVVGTKGGRGVAARELECVESVDGSESDYDSDESDSYDGEQPYLQWRYRGKAGTRCRAPRSSERSSSETETEQRETLADRKRRSEKQKTTADRSLPARRAVSVSLAESEETPKDSVGPADQESAEGRWSQVRHRGTRVPSWTVRGMTEQGRYVKDTEPEACRWADPESAATPAYARFCDLCGGSGHYSNDCPEYVRPVLSRLSWQAYQEWVQENKAIGSKPSVSAEPVTGTAAQEQGEAKQEPVIELTCRDLTASAPKSKSSQKRARKRAQVRRGLLLAKLFFFLALGAALGMLLCTQGMPVISYVGGLGKASKDWGKRERVSPEVARSEQRHWEVEQRLMQDLLPRPRQNVGNPQAYGYLPSREYAPTHPLRMVALGRAEGEFCPQEAAHRARPK